MYFREEYEDLGESDMNKESIANDEDQIISPVTIGCMISAFLENNKKKAFDYANFIADKYRDAGMEKAESIVRKRINGSYKNEPQVVLDESDTILNPNIVSKIATISTAHISENTAGWINFYNSKILRYKKGEYGWIIYIMDYDTDIPDDLKIAMEFAKKNGCDWLCFDRDGEIVNLPTYEW